MSPQKTKETMQKRLITSISLLLIALCTTFFNQIYAQSEADDFVVVLDAGHGGHDPGNLGNGYLEKNIALNIVLKVGSVLEQNQGFKVIYTRKDDTFVDLYVRGEIANKENADLFVSVHCDSHTSNANGAGTFVLGLHANKQNFEIAKKENQVIYLEDNYESRYADYDINSPESVIGLTIMQEEFLDQSIALAKKIQDQFTNKLKRKDREVKQAGFIVLHQTFMPSVLVETGFLTNDEEGAYLNSSTGQQEMGIAIAQAISNYKNALRPNTSRADEMMAATPEPFEATKQETIETPEPEKTVESTKNTEQKKSTYDPYAEAIRNRKKEEVTRIEEAVETKEAVPEKLDEAVVVEPVLEPVAEKKEEVAEVVEEVVSKPVVSEVKEIKQPIEEAKKENVVVKEPVQTTTRTPSSNIIFKVQLMASTKEINMIASNFNGLSELSTEKFKIYNRYMYGNTTSYNHAKELKSRANARGYTSAYIVAYKNGTRIDVNEAIKQAAQ